ncbi:hypothetical protein GGI43DRAFT_431381 [Trichoderma evansii]
MEHWEARFEGTFAEIGDYFNVSEPRNPVPGAIAAWHQVEKYKIKNVEREASNFVKIDRVYVTSPKAGDAGILARVHRLHCLVKLHSGNLVKAGITREGHDRKDEVQAYKTPYSTRLTIVDHCFEVLRYGLMCEGESRIQRVGWPDSDGMRQAWIEVADFCEDPDDEGVEQG